MRRGRPLAAAALARLAVASIGAKLLAAAGVALAATLGLALILLAWLAMVAGAGAEASCAPTAVRPGTVPAQLAPIFEAAAQRYRLGPRGPSILAALTEIESGFGRNMGPSSAGAIGWTQFLPSTWAHYGTDADGDGRKDPYDADDAIHSSARYLRASGAPKDWRRALFAYNHAHWYVDRVLHAAEAYIDPTSAALPVADVEVGCAAGVGLPGGATRLEGGGGLVAIPGFPGERIDVRLLDDLRYLVSHYKVAVTDGYAPTGHKRHGEHPLGLAVDLVPGPGGTWDDVDRLARWAEPQPGRPRPPFRWVGYDGDPNHGRGDHMHLSWTHGPAPSAQPPAPWVLVMGAG